MGSGQSSPAFDGVAGKQRSTTPSEDSSSSPNTTSTAAGPARAKKAKPPPENESAYARANRICRKKKRAYDGCYTAQLSSKEEDCSDLFDAYRACFLRVMSQDMERRGVTVSENSMIGEYKEEVADEEDDR